MTRRSDAAFGNVTRLSDDELTRGLSALVRRDNRLTAELLVHLGELDARRLYASMGYSSLFTYCVTALSFSEDVAYKRVAAARVSRRYPLVLELVAGGKIHLSGLLLVAPHLTSAGHRELLSAACGKSKREVERLVAERFPRQDVRTSVRRLPGRNITRDSGAGAGAALGEGRTLSTAEETGAAPLAGAARDLGPDPCAPGSEVQTSVAQAPVPGLKTSIAEPLAPAVKTPAPLVRPKTNLRVEPDNPKQRSSVEPLAPKRFRVTFTASDQFCDKLERARALASHAVAPSDLASLLERALDALIAREQKRRFAIRPSAARETEGGRTKRRAPVPRPGSSEPLPPGPEEHPERPSPSSANSPLCSEQDPGRPAPATDRLKPSRYIPAHVRRAVWERDQGRCTYVDPATGRQCNERRFLALDHIEPHALGGPGTVGNLRVVCAMHNQHAARLAFGARLLEAMIRRRRGERGNDAG